MGASIAAYVADFLRAFPSSRVVEASTADLLEDYWQRTQLRAVAAPTGLPFLDAALNGGLQAGRLVTLLGAPGSGKTSLANQIAEDVAQERPVLYVTSEDSPDVLIAKTLSRLSNIAYSDVLYGKRRAETFKAIEQLRQRPSAHLLRYMDVTGGAISMHELEERAKAHFKDKSGPGLIVIDYLQRMARATRDLGGVKELREAVSSLTERLRSTACTLNCTVMALASMNRASGYGRTSDALSSAKESGDIEYTSDVIMALTDDTSKNPRMPTKSYCLPRVLRIDKNRMGPITTIDLDWHPDRQQFIQP